MRFAARTFFCHQRIRMFLNVVPIGQAIINVNSSGGAIVILSPAVDDIAPIKGHSVTVNRKFVLGRPMCLCTTLVMQFHRGQLHVAVFPRRAMRPARPQCSRSSARQKFSGAIFEFSDPKTSLHGRSNAATAPLGMDGANNPASQFANLENPETAGTAAIAPAAPVKISPTT